MRLLDVIRPYQAAPNPSRHFNSEILESTSQAKSPGRRLEEQSVACSRYTLRTAPLHRHIAGPDVYGRILPIQDAPSHRRDGPVQTQS